MFLNVRCKSSKCQNESPKNVFIHYYQDQWICLLDLQVDCPLYHDTLVFLFNKFIYKILRISSFDPIFGWNRRWRDAQYMHSTIK